MYKVYHLHLDTYLYYYITLSRFVSKYRNWVPAWHLLAWSTSNCFVSISKYNDRHWFLTFGGLGTKQGKGGKWGWEREREEEEGEERGRSKLNRRHQPLHQISAGNIKRQRLDYFETDLEMLVSSIMSLHSVTGLASCLERWKWLYLLIRNPNDWMGPRDQTGYLW